MSNETVVDQQKMLNEKAIQLLQDTKTLLIAPAAWTKGRMWADINGATVQSPKQAACFCLTGAVAAAHKGKTGDATHMKALSSLWNSLPNYCHFTGVMLSEFNDAPTTWHLDIMQLLDRAIQRIEGENTNSPTTPPPPPKR